MRTTKRTEADRMIVSAADMSSFFAVTPKTVAEWAKNGMPRESHGVYHLKRCFDWWLENINKDDDDETLTAAKRKYWTAKAEKEHLATQQLKGQLIPRSQLVGDRVARCLDMRKGLLALAARLTGPCAMKSSSEIRAAVEAEVYRLLTEFSRPSELWPEGEEKNISKTSKKRKAKKK